MEKQLICLDTSVLIDYFRKTQKENSFLYELTESYENFAVSVITEFEIYSGSNELQQEFWNQSQSDLIYWEHWFGHSKKNRRKQRFPKGFIEIEF